MRRRAARTGRIAAALIAGAALVLLPGAVLAQDHQGHSAHTGKETREIKALSGDEVAALLDGEGAGYALAAELNRHPGPRHALDLSDALSLTASQVDALERIFDEMRASARELGRELVDAERVMDRAFAEGSITSDRLRVLTDSIGRLEARLRYVHMDAHLETRALLTAEQVRRYDRARGYADRSDGSAEATATRRPPR